MHDAKLIAITQGAEEMAIKSAQEVVMYCARVSNPTNQNSTNEGLLKYCIKERHWSIFEMANIVMEINTTRAISPQILRHRSFSYQEFCLTGDARITVRAPGGSIQRIQIKKLYENWNSNRFKARLARCYDTKAERFIEAPIKSVYKTGKKPVYCYKIQTDYSTKEISCTKEHKVLTRELGFVDFGIAYAQKLTIALNGQHANPLPYQQKEILEECAWMGSTQFAKEFGIAEVTARKWFRLFGVKPAKPNYFPKSSINAKFQARLHSFMKWARAEIRKDFCENCGHDGSKSRLEVSHIIAHNGNEDLAFDENNIQTLCASCHRRHDIDMQEKTYGWTLGMTAKWGKIVSEEYLGVQETYDIEMDHDTHNFVANGIVVHNSQRYSNVCDLGYQTPLPKLRRQDEKNRQSSHDDLDYNLKAELEDEIDDLYNRSHLLYLDLINNGVAKECAREILPMGTPTRLYMNGTLRSWITYIALREKNGTQWEHQQVALSCKKVFHEQCPTISNALGGLEAPWMT